MWRTLQHSHYVSIGSKRTSLRWATTVIHQLLLTAWDLWQFRNNRLHGETGPLALAQHTVLDAQIAEDLTIGGAGMLRDTTHLLSIPVATLKSYTLVHKRLWLESVRLGRKQFAQAHTPPPAFAQERAFMLAWRQLAQP